MKHWYVLQVMSGHEKKARKNLMENRHAAGMMDFIEEVLVPSEQVAEVKQGEQKVSEKRVWPGYALINMELTDDAWHYVKNSNGVIDFLGGGKPAPLTPAEVDEIMSEMNKSEGEIVHKHQFEVGSLVKITDGVFVNFVGSVQEVHHEKGRLSVMVSIFGRDTRVDDLEFWQVEEASHDDGKS